MTRKILRKKVFQRMLTIAVILLCGVAITLYYKQENAITKDGATVGGEYVSHDEMRAHNVDEYLRDSDATDVVDSTARTNYHHTHGPD